MTSDIRNPSAECNAIDISALTKLERKDILKFNLELRMQWFKNRHMGNCNLPSHAAGQRKCCGPITASTWSPL
jgi:hypothetical protein